MKIISLKLKPLKKIMLLEYSYLYGHHILTVGFYTLLEH